LTNPDTGLIYRATAYNTEEASMVTLTDTAKKQLDSYFADKEKSPIRVYLSSGG